MKKKPKTLRSKEKHPYLKRNKNLKSRRYVLETHLYVDGVVNQDGEQVIRPLTEEEKDWMNQFLAEHVGAEKLTKDSIHQQSKKDKKKIASLEKELEEVRAKLFKLNIKYNAGKKSNKTNLEKIEEQRVELCRKREELKDELYYLDYQKYNYGTNNKRNDDIYNKLRKTGKLRIVDPQTLNSYGYEDLEEYSLKYLYTDYEEPDNLLKSSQYFNDSDADTDDD